MICQKEPNQKFFDFHVIKFQDVMVAFDTAKSEVADNVFTCFLNSWRFWFSRNSFYFNLDLETLSWNISAVLSHPSLNRASIRVLSDMSTCIRS